MGQKQLRYTEAACGSVDMSRDESVLILLQHCRDMKQQETRLRVITLLLLLLSCVALFIFPLLPDAGSSGRGSSAEPSPAYSKQARACSADDPSTDPATTSKRLRVHLTSTSEPNRTAQSFMMWAVVFGENYNPSKRAIEISEDGFYFVYVRMIISCQARGNASQIFSMNLEKWSEGYDKIVVLMNALDGVVCKDGVLRTVSVGQLFDLSLGDHIAVLVKEGYEQITQASFGAFLV